MTKFLSHNDNDDMDVTSNQLKNPPAVGQAININR